MALLNIKDLHVNVAGKEIIRGIDLEIEEGRTAVIFGPNGSGKSTLMGAIAGLPGYDVTKGLIEYKGHDIKQLSTDDRARLGIGLSYQYPPAVKGVRLRTLLESMTSDREIIPEYADMLNLSGYLDRDINVGFSGGERKRSEVLQLMVQTPDLMLLDEPESGVDIENISIIANALKSLLEKEKPITKRTRSALIITHTGFILDYLRADVAHVIMNGRVLGCGSPSEIFEEIRLNGYSKCSNCFAEQFKENNIC
ncbi:MAG: ABC transporter ATP-binding protein [Deltaproteobacteria bacterium]|nr:ABC transporter ATP-binding protein [Deltaproteobacteria bacterium]